MWPLFFLDKIPLTHMTMKKAISVWKYSCTGVIINNHCMLHPEYIAAPLSIGFISLKLLKEKFCWDLIDL